MPRRAQAAPLPNRRRGCILSCLGALVLGAGSASAFSPDQLERLPSVVVVQATAADEQAGPEQPAQGDEQGAASALEDLNEVLAATQAKLQELFEATAALAEGGAEFEALKQENERLAAALAEANTARADLERASERAEARIAELTAAVDEAVRASGRSDEELAGLRRHNADLAERLADADKARDAAHREVERTRSDMQEKLEAATGTTEQLRGEVAQLREQLARAGQQFARAQTAHEQARARVSELERSSGDAEGVRAELAALKEQLGQAATAAVEAERNRQTASAEAEQLRGELERAHQEVAAARTEAERGRQTAGADADRLRAELVRTRRALTAAKSEVERVSTANAQLEEKVTSLEADSQSAMEVARRNLVVMEQRIEQLNTALAGAGLAQRTAPPGEREAEPSSSREEPAVASRSPAATTAPAEDPGAGPDAEDASELAAAPAATAGPPDARSELAKFNENIEYLNRRAAYAAGSNLFSGIEAAGDGVVHVSTTPAWDKIPAEGQRSYLNSLLDLWIVAREDSGPAVVRIIDSNGRVLLEKAGAVQDLPQD